MSRNTVMVVDDEEGVRRSWQRFLEDRGVATMTAPDGASAIDQLSRQPVDVVVSDLRMPGKNGLELLEWLHERQPDTRFIMLTGYGNKRLEWQVRELGAVDYFEKPVSPDVLAHAVERALDPQRIPMVPMVALKRSPADITEAAGQNELQEVESLPEEVAIPGTGSPMQTLGLVIAAPFLGLAFVVFLPVIGIAALAWVLFKEIRNAIWPATA